MTSVSAAVAHSVLNVTDVVFGIMGNGNAHVVSELTRGGVRYISARHEGGAVAMADAYFRASGRVSVATTTYGPGFTNTLTALGEAAQARIPLILLTGGVPVSGARRWDVDQVTMAGAAGVETLTITVENAQHVVAHAARRAHLERRPLVLSLPYDVGLLEVDDAVDDPFPELDVESLAPPEGDLDYLVKALSEAERPLLVLGRGAVLAGATEIIRDIGDAIGGLFATSVMARNALDSPWDLGIAGGFSRGTRYQRIAEADVVVAFGASLNMFQTRHGKLFAGAHTVVSVSLEAPIQDGVVQRYIEADAYAAALALRERVRARYPEGRSTWRDTLNAEDWALDHLVKDGDEVEISADGRLDPRPFARELNRILPRERIVVQDGGHFLGWFPMYADIPDPYSLVMSGTAFQVIGLGFPFGVGAAAAQPDRLAVLVSGDGGGLMALPDLETFIRETRRGVVVVFNDAAYGAELHQYASRGLDPKAMQIDEVDFAAVGRALGADGIKARSLSDLGVLAEWLSAGDEGVFVLDLPISKSVVATYMAEAAGLREHGRDGKSLWSGSYLG